MGRAVMRSGFFVRQHRVGDPLRCLLGIGAWGSFICTDRETAIFCEATQSDALTAAHAVTCGREAEKMCLKGRVALSGGAS